MSTLKALIMSLTDFEFLSAISNINFHTKKIFFKRHFWNTLMKNISKNVQINSERDLHAIISSIKKMCFTRLGLVSPHSMKRFFLQQIPMVFEAFRHRIEKFFRLNVQKPTVNRLTEEEKLQVKKDKRREARRRNRNNRRERKLLEDQVTFENEEQSDEEEKEEKKKTPVDPDLIVFRTAMHLRQISGMNYEDQKFLEENYPDFWNETISKKRVLGRVLKAHLEESEDEEEEEEEIEEEEESTEEEEDSEEEEDEE